MRNTCAMTGKVQEAGLVELPLRDVTGEPVMLSSEALEQVAAFISKQRGIYDARRKLAVARAEAEAQAPAEKPDAELVLSPTQTALVRDGQCPFCERIIRGWRSPIGGAAEEVARTLRVNGTDPKNGHALSCARPDFRIAATSARPAQVHEMVSPGEKGPRLGP